MNEADVILPPPQIEPPARAPDVWTRNRDYFVSHRAEFMEKHRGKYVAVNEEQIVAVGDDKLEVANAAYAKCGYVPVYVGLVGEDNPRIVRMPSPIRVVDRDV
jgi:hypothetical protein